jgi:hypothetical protein
MGEIKLKTQDRSLGSSRSRIRGTQCKLRARTLKKYSHSRLATKFFAKDTHSSMLRLKEIDSIIAGGNATNPPKYELAIKCTFKKPQVRQELLCDAAYWTANIFAHVLFHFFSTALARQSSNYFPPSDASAAAQSKVAGGSRVDFVAKCRL